MHGSWQLRLILQGHCTVTAVVRKCNTRRWRLQSPRMSESLTQPWPCAACRLLEEDNGEALGTERATRTPGRDITQELLAHSGGPPQHAARRGSRGRRNSGPGSASSELAPTPGAADGDRHSRDRVIAVGRDAYGPCEYVVNPAFPHLPAGLPLSLALTFHACIRPDPATRPTFQQVRTP